MDGKEKMKEKTTMGQPVGEIKFTKELNGYDVGSDSQGKELVLAEK